jgi:hypothetical protein
MLSPPHRDEEAHQLHDLVPTRAMEALRQAEHLFASLLDRAFSG